MSSLDSMSPTVRTEDLMDARDVAELLGLSHPSAVSVYQHRYKDMPRPIVDLGRGRPKLWLRSEIETWGASQVASGRTRRKRPRR
jgi:glutathione-regulated potassium-efflux system ancillary protein KefG